jgi:hypothetical protein
MRLKKEALHQRLRLKRIDPGQRDACLAVQRVQRLRRRPDLQSQRRPRCGRY